MKIYLNTFILSNHANGIHKFSKDIYMVLVLVTEPLKMTAQGVYNTIKKVICANKINGKLMITSVRIFMS